MAKNRAQRRAKANKSANSQGVEKQGTTVGRWDLPSFDTGLAGEWTPARVISDAPDIPANDTDPQLKPIRTGWGWAKLVSWIFIVGSAIAMIVVMWIPNVILLTIGIVSLVFFLSVLSLFIVQSPNDVNPYLDSNGTAV